MSDSRLCSPARLEALHRSRLLESVEAPAFDRLTGLARQMLDVPCTFVSLLTCRRLVVRSHAGLPEEAPREIPVSQSLCRHVVGRDAPLIVPDVTTHPLTRAEPAGEVVAYLGVPLRTPEGEPVGAFCAVATEPRDWDERAVEQMEALAASATTEIALRMQVKALERERRARIADEALAQASLDALMDVFFVLDETARLTRWNRRLREVLGYTDAELGTMDLSTIFAESDGPKIEAAIERVLTEGEAVAEARLRTRHGDVIPYEFNGRALRDEAGRVVGLVGTGRDLSERRRTEARFRSFVEATAQVVWRADEAGNVTELGAAWQHFTGQTAEEVSGWGWLEAVHPEDLERVLPAWRRHLSAGMLYEDEYRVRRRDGRYHWFAVRAVPVSDGDGRVAEWVGTCTHIHEARRAAEALAASEERLRLAVEAASLGTWDIDLASGRSHWSPEAEALYGLPPGAFDGIPETLLQLIHPEDRERVQQVTERAVAEGGCYEIEHRALRRDGETRWMHSAGQVLCDEAGRPARLVGVVRDVTERRAYEAELRRARERAEEMSRLKTAFLTNMSHEIRTPLTSIIGFSEVLVEDFAEADSEMGEMIGMIRSNGRRLLDTLNDVLDLSQLEAGALPLQQERADLATVAAEHVAYAEAEARRRGLALSCAGPAAPACVDRRALDRVVTNLVANALKFTERGHVTLRTAMEGDHAVLRVEDTGIGIDPDFLPHVFDEFRQGSTGSARTHEGNGLGLSLTRRLVERMQGTIAVESEPGRGTTFTVRLPRA